MKCLMFCIIGVLLFSCKESKKERVNRLAREWDGKEIVFPNNMSFTTMGKDTNYLFKREFSIVTYVDSVGCTGCKLQLTKWKYLITQLDSICDISTLFFLYPKDKKELNYLFEQERFTHPVCIDEQDSFNKLNRFPDDMMFRTFLLDKDNKVIAIGNPIHDPKIKEFYLKVISGDKFLKKEETIQTTVACSNAIIDFGKFDWKQEQKSHFIIENTGNNPLVVIDVATSCGCTSVEYNKEPVRPGDNVELIVYYKANHPEHFNKTITLYCNASSSPIKLEIKGSSK